MKKISWGYLLTGVVFFSSLILLVFAVRAIAKPEASPELIPTKTKGPDNAPIEIVEYSDFQCPACGKVQSYLGDLLTKYEGKIRLIFRHYPLPGHQHALSAHTAAECAQEQAQFWVYHDRLYQEQAVWSAMPDPLERFLSYAKEQGIELEKFGQCLVNPEVAKRIAKEKRSGQLAGVRSTPSFVVNGQLFAGSQQMMLEGEQYIAKELKEKGLV